MKYVGWDKKISINEYAIDHGTSEFSYQLFQTIRHELRHAYQHNAISNPDEFIVSQATLDAWRNSIENPVSANADYAAYLAQPHEENARDFGKID